MNAHNNVIVAECFRSGVWAKEDLISRANSLSNTVFLNISDIKT